MNYRHLLLATALLSAPAYANDTTAELKTGGIVFTHNETIEMAKEDLFISPEKVEVNYVFRNTGDKDITTYVAFPMPDMQGGPGENTAYNDFEAENFLGFKAEQDGKPVDVSVQQRVSAAGIDYTDDLKKRNIPFLPLSEKTTAALDALPADVQDDFVTKGLVMRDEYDAGNGVEKHLAPLWVLSQVYYWKTTFPAGQEVKVHHTYKPSVGGTVAMTFLDENNEAKGPIYDEYVKKYCIDDTIVKIAKTNNDNMGNNKPYYYESWISYILITAGNWGMGAIGDFHLTVDKGNKDSLVSFCGNGVKKTGPTTFEIRAKDYFPEQDLNILLLNLQQPEAQQ